MNATRHSPIYRDRSSPIGAEVQAVRTRSRYLVASYLQLVTEATPFHLEAEVALRESVREFADLLRQAEMPPEAVVIEVKAMVRDGSADAPSAHRLVERDLTADVVTWAIDGYFTVRG